MLKNSSILITGGTGSFGKAFVDLTLRKYKPKKIIVYSRDEMKQWDMKQKYLNDNRLRFFIGDVRDKERLNRAMNGIDYVIHAAALKIVPTAEYNPFECIKTNIIGTMNVIEACIDNKVKKTVALSTDKASSPSNIYGASKLASDKVFVSGNFSYAGGKNSKFSVVRYGNVMGSRGSILPLFLNLNKTNKPFPITDIRMTRFMITLESGIELVWHALKNMIGGEIYVKKIPSIKIMDIAKAINSNKKINVIGVRPGEKIHEQMIGSEDARNTYEFSNHFVIFPDNEIILRKHYKLNNLKKVKENFIYSSDKNNEWMTVKELSLWIKKSEYKVGKI
jgi:UDP-N-acetylglucosamine 4,6-dehydratase/5-epimerase